ncbi:MAG: rhomboid family intramembrane serine protease, partial [Planctomycetes bacterium]|nr:rhomboid family intramembrane serine protease [Planctomycetota bacterium]
MPLVESRTPLGYVYVCPQCGGQRAAMAILRRAGASPAFLKHIWAAALSADATRRLACPECRRPMASVPTFLETHRLDLDVCPSCQSVWLDRAEFEAIPKAPRGKAAAPVPRAAGVPSAAEEEEWPPEVRRADAAAPAPAADQSPQAPAAPPAERELSPRARQQAAVMQVQARGATESEAVAGSRMPEHAWHWVPGLLGMPVESAEPVRRERPWTTWSIAAFLVAVFLVTLPGRVQVIQEWGFVPAAWARHGGLTLLVSFFLHAGLFHLLSNVYFFVVFGDNVED